MNAQVLKAVEVLMAELQPGETCLYRLVPAGQVVAPGKQPQAAMLVVTLPLTVGQHQATVPMQEMS